MSRLLPSQLNRVSVNKTEQVMEPQEPKLHVVRFNPLLIIMIIMEILL